MDLEFSRKVPLFVGFLLALSLFHPPLAGQSFIRGDVNEDGLADVSDAIFILGHLFIGLPPVLDCYDAADLNDEGRVDISDTVFLHQFLFYGGVEMQPPYPGCGLDPTPDSLGCRATFCGDPTIDEGGAFLDPSFSGWFDTRADNSLLEDDSLFDVGVIDNEAVLRTESSSINVHSHYVGGGSSSWESYEFSGKMLRHAEGIGGIGVTFLSAYPRRDVYYRLRQVGSNPFHIAPHGTSITGGDSTSDVVPVAGVWYRFQIVLTDAGWRTEIRAKVWPDGQPEPTSWQIDCFDSSATRLTSGTVGCWSMGPAAELKYWGEFEVNQQATPFVPEESAFLTLEINDTLLRIGESSAMRALRVDPTGTLDVSSEATYEVSQPSLVRVTRGSPTLATGMAIGFVTITATHNGISSSPVSVAVFPQSEPADGIPASSVSRSGITWNFDQTHQVGRFANGDFWVVGPATVVSVSPLTVRINGVVRHGSVVDPMPGDEQGYDDRIGGYRSSLTARFPVTLNPNDSLVSTVSWLEGEPGIPPIDSTGGPRPTLKTAAVLTCLAAPPPQGSFRPPYAGNDKPLFATAHLQRHLLLDLPPVPSTPATARLVRDFDRVWLDTKMAWSGRNAHPSLNMPDYGRDLAANINDGILALMLDTGDKEELLVRVVQIGIDFYGLLENGGYWGTIGGGHGPGRKWPILFAGLMLGHEGMKNIGFDYGPERFQEDCQSFYVTAEDHNRFPDLFPVIGAPAWGSRHCNRPHEDDMWRGYRLCCTANNWVGAVLAARMLGARGLWNHDALFDYQDFHMPAIAASHGVGDSRRSWTDFAEEMWDTYRSDY